MNLKEGFAPLVLVPYEDLIGILSSVLMRLSVPEQDALDTAEAIVAADLRGIESHGVVRFPTYVKRIRLGIINPKPNIKVIRESRNVILIDADNGLGQVAGKLAMSMCIEKAKENDVAIAGVRNTNHIGIAGHYAMMPLRENMIGIVLTNTAALMAPHGGCEPVLGTNPFAVAIPAGREIPIVLDMSTSVVSRGKIEESLRKGEKIPFGWAVDNEGNHTDDPEKALEGALLPLGGAKGYGMSIVIDIISGLLTGSSYGKDIKSMFLDFTKPMGVGNFMVAIKVESFMPVDEFKEKVDGYIKMIKGSKRAKGVDEILLPGERSYRTMCKRLKEGVPLGEGALRALEEAKKLVGM